MSFKKNFVIQTILILVSYLILFLVDTFVHPVEDSLWTLLIFVYIGQLIFYKLDLGYRDNKEKD
ncbi:hypothetical protein M662_16140 [Bacillus sp. SB49]|uniref:hypothetical protein n=1 Tax=Bacillaceae TaxID=186817 RepID=UPI0002A4DC21|nr:MULTISPECIES: hypothetical protein [Bacillaceae]ELK45857.1 hypothetical protein D479_13258 [Halobacillus sp. BAB-2008]QHT47947.1 hypothetical protein M662_16140 [Bacillus sp. SB49]